MNSFTLVFSIAFILLLKYDHVLLVFLGPNGYHFHVFDPLFVLYYMSQLPWWSYPFEYVILLNLLRNHHYFHVHVSMLVCCCSSYGFPPAFFQSNTLSSPPSFRPCMIKWNVT